MGGKYENVPFLQPLKAAGGLLVSPARGQESLPHFLTDGILPRSCISLKWPIPHSQRSLGKTLDTISWVFRLPLGRNKGGFV